MAASGVSRWRVMSHHPFAASTVAYTIDTRGELHPGIKQEWLLTNGVGGFAFGTVVGCNTRRYHALLCAAMLPPVGRIVMLNRLREILTIDGQDVHEFSVNQFGPDRFQPQAMLVGASCTAELIQDDPGGLAKALVSVIGSEIVARGEVPFLQAYTSNVAALATYTRLGFEPRRNLTFTTLQRR